MASLTLANSLKVQSSFSIAAPLLELCNPSLVLLASFDETVVIAKVELRGTFPGNRTLSVIYFLGK